MWNVMVHEVSTEPYGINILMCIFPSNYDLAWKNRRASLGNLDIERDVYLLWCYYSCARFVRGNVLRQVCYNIFCKHNAGSYEWLGFLFCHITQEPSVDGGGSLSSLYFVCWSYPFFQQTSWGFQILSDRIDTHSELRCVIFVRRNELPVSFVFENIFRPFLYQEAFQNSAVYRPHRGLIGKDLTWGSLMSQRLGNNIRLKLQTGLQLWRTWTMTRT